MKPFTLKLSFSPIKPHHRPTPPGSDSTTSQPSRLWKVTCSGCSATFIRQSVSKALADLDTHIDVYHYQEEA